MGSHHRGQEPFKSVDDSFQETLGNIYSLFGLSGLAREYLLTTVDWAPPTYKEHTFDTWYFVGHTQSTPNPDHSANVCDNQPITFWNLVGQVQGHYQTFRNVLDEPEQETGGKKYG